jgi:hypothetical protein
MAGSMMIITSANAPANPPLEETHVFYAEASGQCERSEANPTGLNQVKSQRQLIGVTASDELGNFRGGLARIGRRIQLRIWL